MKKVIIPAITSVLFIMTLVFTMNTTTIKFGEEAFAGGSCCPEIGSICISPGSDVIMKNAYYKPKGPCRDIIGMPSSPK